MRDEFGAGKEVADCAREQQAGAERGEEDQNAILKEAPLADGFGRLEIGSHSDGDYDGRRSDRARSSVEKF